MAFDATNKIQDMVNIAIPGLTLDGIALERKIALSYVLNPVGDNTEYYIKLLCFHDKDQNCFHVRIQKDRNGVPKYMTKTPPMRVREEVTQF